MKQRIYFSSISLSNWTTLRLGRYHSRIPMTFHTRGQPFLSTYCGLSAWFSHCFALLLLPWYSNGLVIISRLSSVDLHPTSRVCNSSFLYHCVIDIISNSTHPFLPLWRSGEFQDDDCCWKHPDVLACCGWTVHLGTYSVPISNQPDCFWFRCRHLWPAAVVVYRDDRTPELLGGVSLPNTIFCAYLLSLHSAADHLRG